MLSIDFASVDRNAIDPTRRSPETLKGDHVVGLYEDADALAKGAGTFLAASLRTGGAAISIATPEHTAAIERHLLEQGFDLEKLAADGLYRSADAAATLERFVVNGDVAPLLFTEVIGALISQLTMRRNPIRIYGEMVSVMWADGDQAGALHLEQVWNLLAKIHSFDLLCGYPLDLFEQDDIEKLSAVCREHTHVLTPLT